MGEENKDFQLAKELLNTVEKANTAAIEALEKTNHRLWIAIMTLIIAGTLIIGYLTWPTEVKLEQSIDKGTFELQGFEQNHKITEGKR